MACVESPGVWAQRGRDSSNTQRPQPQKKGLAPVRQEDGPDGSRVTVTYNAPLSDYSAYRQGDRFVVVIPKADAPRLRSNLRGRGFDGVQVERRGEDTVLSFRIRPGTKARVDQQHNRLDVVFSTPEQAISNAPSGQTTAAVSSQSLAAKASQTNQTRAGTTQTPLANHNSMPAATAQPGTVKPVAEVTVAGGSTAGTPAQSPAPSTVSPATTAPSHADDRAAPAVSPTLSSASTGTGATRYWLPLVIALLLLLTSAWAYVASRRRRALEPSSTPSTKSEEETTVEAETTALLPESPGETFEARDADDEGGPRDAQEIGREASEPESEETAWPANDGPTATVVTVGPSLEGQPGFDESPAPAATDGSAIPSEILKHLGSEDVNERSAGVLGLADFLSDEAFGRIGAAFDDPSQQVRDAAARSLFNFSADRAASFKRLMRDASPERRRRVGEAIASSGMAGEAISDLSHASGERAYDALLVLSLMARSGEVRSLIETIEEHPSTEVRLALVKLLALSGRQEILHAFRYLSTRDSLPIAVRSSIMEAIYQLNNPQSLPVSTT